MQICPIRRSPVRQPAPTTGGQRADAAFPGVQPAIQGGEIRVRAETGVHAGDGEGATLTPSPSPRGRGEIGLLLPWKGRGQGGGVLFQHHMRVRAAETEGADPGAARAGHVGPGCERLHAAGTANCAAL